MPHRRPPTISEQLHDVFEVAPGAHDPFADLANAAGTRIEERLHAPSRVRTRRSAYAFLLLAIVGGVTGTSALAASHGFTRPVPILIMALAYLVCFLALTRALKAIPIGVAYAMWSGLGIALTTLIGWRVFEQQLNAGTLVGIALILAGVVVLQLFSRTKAH